MGFWDTLKKAKCEYLRSIGECQLSKGNLPCRDMDQDGFCTGIIIDLDPCGETWETEKVTIPNRINR